MPDQPFVLSFDAGGVLFQRFADASKRTDREDTDQASTWIEGSQDAIRAFQAEGYEIIVNSFSRKKRTGDDTTRSVHSLFPTIPVHIVDDRAKKVGVLEGLNKPSLMVDDREDVLVNIAKKWTRKDVPCPILVLFGSQPRNRLIHAFALRWKDLKVLVKRLAQAAEKRRSEPTLSEQ